VLVPGVNGATSVSIGDRFACALSADGSARCWGANDLGALGENVPIGGQSAPVLVASNLTAIAAGASTACGQAAGGSWRCWGADVSHVDATGSPTAAPQGWDPEIDGALSVGFGTRFTSFGCALAADGSVRCFGVLPWATDSSPVFPPEVVSNLPGITQLAVGADYACGVTTSGQVACWGNNEFGQLGVTPSTAPAPPTLVPGVDGATQVVVGGPRGEFACALLLGGTVECWGKDFAGATDGSGFRPVWGGECGVNYSPLDPCSAPVAISGVSGVAQLAAGTGVCALRADGTVGCWALLM
jgi:hypothetical protein